MTEAELFEQLKIPFDIDLLRAELIENTRNIDPVMMGSHFGGWSITSSTGQYTDGWIKSSFNSVGESIEELHLERLRIDFKGRRHYRTPTQLCVGEMGKIISFLNSNGFLPCRARYTLLKPGGATAFHRDYPDWLYGVRLHIPIITNASCFFEYEGIKKNLLADGSAYLLKINRLHRVYNNGTTDRIHFLCDFFDTKQKTIYNKYSSDEISE